MKNILALCVLLCICLQLVQAQTAPTQNCSAATNNILPNTDTVIGFSPLDVNLAPIQRGVPVHDTLYFRNYTSLTYQGIPITMNSMTFDSIYLPTGLCWSTNVSNNTFAGGQNGVVYITGITYDTAGQYKLRMIVTANTSLATLVNINAEQYAGLIYKLRVTCSSGSTPPVDNSPADSAYAFMRYSDSCTLNVGASPISASWSRSPSTSPLTVGQSVTFTAVSNASGSASYSWTMTGLTSGVPYTATGRVVNETFYNAEAYNVCVYVVDGTDSAQYCAYVSVDTASSGGGGTLISGNAPTQNCNAATNNIIPNTDTIVGLLPLDVNLAPIQRGVAVHDTLYFRNYASLTYQGIPITMNSLTFDSIFLPTGLCWSTNVSNNTFGGGQNGVVYITGTTYDTAGQYKLRIIVTANTSLATLSNIDAERYAGLIYKIRIACSGGSTPAVDNSTADSAYAFMRYSDSCTLAVGTSPLSVSWSRIPSTSTVTIGQNVTFTANSNASASAIYLWTMTGLSSGNSYTASGNAVSQTFNTIESYNICVTAVDGADTAHYCNYLTVDSVALGGGTVIGGYAPTENCHAATNSITPNTDTVVGLLPLDVNLAPIQRGVAVHDTLYFRNYTSLTYQNIPITMNSLTFDSIYLPTGLCWSTNVSNNTFAGGQNGVIYITGTTYDTAGQYKLRIIVTANTSLATLSQIDAERYAGLIYKIRVACSSGSTPAVDNSLADSAYSFIPYSGSCTLGTGVSISASAPVICPAAAVALTANAAAGASFLWSTGATTQSISVTAPGVYTVTASEFGISQSASYTLDASSLSAQISLQADTTPHVWVILNQCTGQIINYQWTWGDGSVTTTTNPTPAHTYDSAGYYSICVHVTDSSGCSAEACDSGVYLYKDQSGQIIQVYVVQYPLGITNTEAPRLSMSYYAGAVHFSEMITTPAQVYLCDMSGRVAMSAERFTGSTLPIDGLAAGVYLIHLQNDQYSAGGKLVIVR